MKYEAPCCPHVLKRSAASEYQVTNLILDPGHLPDDSWIFSIQGRIEIHIAYSHQTPHQAVYAGLLEEGVEVESPLGNQTVNHLNTSSGPPCYEIKEETVKTRD